LIAGGALGHLLRLNLNRNLQERKYYPGLEFAYSLATDEEGSIYLLARDTLDPGQRLMKLDQQGTIQWKVNLPAPIGFPTYRVAVGPTGLVAVTGGTAKEDSFSFYQFNGAGEELVRRPLPSYSFDISGLANGNWATVRTWPNLPGQLTILNTGGATLREIPLSEPLAVASENRKYLVVLGRSSEGTYLAKYDLNGILLWQNVYPQTPGEVFITFANDLHIDAQEQIVFPSALLDGSIGITKVAEDGTFICSEVFQFPSTYTGGQIQAMVSTPDRGYALTGRVGYRAVNSNDVLLLRSDSLCNFSDRLESNRYEDTLQLPDTTISSAFSGSYFPNPTLDYIVFEIESNEPIQTPLTIDLYDALGRLIGSFMAEAGRTTIPLDQRFPSGMYFMQWSQGDQKIGDGKLVVQRR